ncbi:AMP-binding protein [Streptomyces sp. NBC_01387]|uniref:class I adenylate-forming enzyme family protein n=1 Tax=unclassified Streptomyces TaxID=2593676 RepID=UPI002023BF7C|nr:AMP-binding protein [Streptomyces sp. A 4/2]WSV58056.1 AMP-binding protein [Streptomyces sp. NBC_01014]
MARPTDQHAVPSAPAAGPTGPGEPFELVDEEVLGARMPVFKNRRRALHELLADSLRHGESDYVVTTDERLTFTGHAALVSSLAESLRTDHGVRKGDRVAIAAANSPEWIMSFWAAVSIGAVAVGFNAWWSGRELAYGIGHVRPTVVIADAKRAALIDDPRVPVLSVETDVPLLARKYPQAALPSCDVAEDDPAVILYTSGTSGLPKGAVHSHRNLLAVVDFHAFSNSRAQEYGGPAAAARRHLLALPLFHIAGLHNLVVPQLAAGGTVVMHRGAFDVDKVLRLIERERVTNWGAVPTMAHRLVEHGDLSGYDLSSLTAFSLASAPSSPAFKDRLREALPVARQALVDSYGLTETSTGVAAATPAELAEFPGTLGRPNVTVTVEIRDPAGNALPEGEEGEVCVRSAFNMLGYWEDPEATAKTVRAGRWLHTGDIGRIDGGLLRLTSRRSDLILRGGENVYPAEIENVLAEHPGVRECIVLGVPHPDLGQEVGAVVVTQGEPAPTERELTAYARERLAHYKVPSRWRITGEELPRGASGKVVRRDVRL